MHIHLARILGKPSFATFLIITFLIVSIMASVNVASRYALKEYVENQLRRIEWDISAYQSGDVQAVPAVAAALQATDGVQEVGRLLFLRNSMTTEDVARIDGRPVRLPWLSLLTASDVAMLPLGIRPAEGKAVLVLVGTKAQMGDAYADLQNRKRFELMPGGHHAGADHDSGPHAAGFEVALERTVRIERKDLNRWFLEQTSSPSLIPEIGAILVTPYDPALIDAFDTLASRIVALHEDGDVHEESSSYFPDLVHLLRIDTGRLVSGWDINGSLERLKQLESRLEANVFPVGPRTFIDSSVTVLLERMSRIANRVGFISLLIALPLLWVGWVLMASLSATLLLNERRKFGLLRLRGASGPAMGRSLQLSIGSGALLGGVAGALAGTLLPVRLYEGAMLPWRTVLIVQEPAMLIAFIAIGVAVALAVSRKLVRYAATISPLEASGRVIRSEAVEASVTFGWTGFLALLLGGYKMLAWALGFGMTAGDGPEWVRNADRLLDFAAFPLFVFGAVTFFVSRRRLMDRVLRFIAGATAGRMCDPAVRHMATRPHRIAAFILIVAMMTAIGLYPTIMTAVFDDKIGRAAEVQVGSDIQLTVNAADLVDNELLAEGGLARQYRALGEKIPALLASLRRIDGVRSAAWILFEGVTDGVYVPGYGFNGLPLYFIPDTAVWLDAVYHEDSLGKGAGLADLVEGLSAGRVILSPAVSDFIRKTPGEETPVGRRTGGSGMVTAPVGGAVWYLPASPLVSVTDRESFDAARIDYVNYLFANNAYMVADPNVASVHDMDVLITGVQFAISLTPGASPEAVRAAMLESLPVEPSTIRTFDEELGKIGSDMYILLARQNVQIYLVAGLLLAVTGILAVAHANYVADRRTLGLLRIRGAGPGDVLRFFGSGLFAPSFIGLALGIAVSLITGFGMTNVIWELREVKNLLLYLATHLAISGRTVLLAAVLLLVATALGFVFSRWVFRKTARESSSER